MNQATKPSAKVWEAVLLLTSETVGIMEAAKLLRISEGTVRSWVSRGQVQTYQIGTTKRITLSEVERIRVEILGQMPVVIQPSRASFQQ